MKSVIIFIYTLMLIGMLTVCNAWCHGVEGYVVPERAYCVTAMYDDGEPMSYSAVEIKAPGSDIAFQTGRTDRNGCFTVKPDIPGGWKAVVSDGLGHRLELDFTVAADPAAAGPAEETTVQKAGGPPVSRPMGIAAGLSIIFGVSGLVYGWKARRKDAA